jgi:hypothetical protein
LTQIFAEFFLGKSSSLLAVIVSGAPLEKGGGAESDNPVDKPATLEFLAAEKSSLKKSKLSAVRGQVFSGRVRHQNAVRLELSAHHLSTNLCSFSVGMAAEILTDDFWRPWSRGHW